MTEFPENMLKHSHIDFAMHGEIDYQLCDLLEELEKDVPRFGEIPNLIWREDGHIIKNEKQTITTDVDSLPFPDREIYYKYPFLRNMDLKRFLSGRGCPYFCAFCSIPAFLGKYLGRKEILRRHSVDRVIAEVLHVKERYPLRVVHFHDDIFPFNIKWLEEFSDRYRKEIDVPFICNARLDTTKQRFDLLKEAGCGGVQLGLESADEEMRNKLLAKSLTDESIIDTTAYLHKIGLPFLTTSIVNLPGETIDDAIATVDLNVRIKPKRMRLGRLTPIPNLPITDYGQEHGFIRKDFDEDEIEGANTNYMITEYDEEFLLVTQYSVLLEFFPSLRPLYTHLVKKKKKVRPLLMVCTLLNFYQEFKWFGFSWRRGLSFFFNTIRVGTGLKWGSWGDNAKDFNREDSSRDESTLASESRLALRKQSVV